MWHFQSKAREFSPISAEWHRLIRSAASVLRAVTFFHPPNLFLFPAYAPVYSCAGHAQGGTRQ